MPHRLLRDEKERRRQWLVGSFDSNNTYKQCLQLTFPHQQAHRHLARGQSRAVDRRAPTPELFSAGLFLG